MMNLLSWYSPKLPVYLVYMLQQVNYRAPKFVAWLHRNPNLKRVIHRKTLDRTKAAKLLLGFTAGALIGLLLISVAMLLLGDAVVRGAGLLLLLASPYLSGLVLVLAVSVADVLVAAPKEKRMEQESERLFAAHPAIKVGVAGSYGKTTVKEVLAVVLGEKYKVAVTPGNMNTPIAHARFARKLKGDEDVLVLEYGEEYPGDTAKFIETTHPDFALLVGLAPNHLDYYKTLDALAADLLQLRTLGKKLYINGGSEALKKYLRKNDNIVTPTRAGDWRISNIQVTLAGTSFMMSKGKQILRLKSGLIGRHHVAPLAMVVLLAQQLGLSNEQIKAGLEKTTPFEHRMQPRHLAGATILDDTYNGNLEGILAGLDLLSELQAKRKIYVTPGLVDQGDETLSAHHAIAKKLYDVAPDLVVLMDNSATRIIEDALGKLGYKGMVRVEEDPLTFYTNIDQVLAAGDIVMMQNDWTDNYN